MRLLFCCEFYFPSVGGVQEVMRQIAERMVARGHEVTVATTRLADRHVSQLNGVNIVEFGITGNLANGIQGEVGRYQEFVASFPCDAVLVKAAQQWTFDALWPVLDRIKARKVFIPCGFSGLHEPAYRQYFADLPDILRCYDHLIFYAESYRDIDFTRQHGFSHFSVLPNGASELEFNVAPDPGFRARHGIPEDSFLLLTVGTLTGVKGHREIAEAFARMNTHGRHASFIMNGNPPPRPAVDTNTAFAAECVSQPASASRVLAWTKRRITRIFGLAYRSVGVLRREGFSGVRQRLLTLTAGVLLRLLTLTAGVVQPLNKYVGFLHKAAKPLAYWIDKARRQAKTKLLLQIDLPRAELVQAYMAADLFVFASNIEYSPLVLFEAAAAGTPFLSVPVGNAQEIARWTGGGMICPAPKDERGYTRVDPRVLAAALDDAMGRRTELRQMGEHARKVWLREFTWNVIAARYEEVFLGEVTPAQASTARPLGVTDKPYSPGRTVPLISVLLPVRNGGPALFVALQSVLQQSFTDFELLLLDDGSTDGSAALAASLGDPRILVHVDGQGRGLAARLNQGTALARGKYIARMDADDLAFPERLAKQFAYLESHPEIDLLGCRGLVFRGEGEVLGQLPFAADHAALCATPWRNIPLPHPGWMGRADWFRRHPYRIPEVRRAEDQELLLRACTDSRYACLDEVLLAYRQGSFMLGKTLLARRSLLAAQLGLFSNRHQWLHALRALMVSAVKVPIDLAAALPAADRLFFWRMAGPVPAPAVAILHQLLKGLPERKSVRTAKAG